MSLISLRSLLDHASEHCYAIPAFNISSFYQIKPILEAAKKTFSPVILQFSTKTINHFGSTLIKYIVKGLIKDNNKIPICIHQDHATSVDICCEAIKLGFSSVMIDGSLIHDSNMPSNFKYNTEITSKVVNIAHKFGISVEAELGCLGSLETGLSGEEDGIFSKDMLSKDDLLTDPKEALDFVNSTNVDALAIAIGTSHGAYKFKSYPSKEMLDISRVKDINNIIPDTHLVMHGASSISSDLIDIINNNGGSIPETYGVPIGEVIKTIKYGVRKVNIDTDLRLAAFGSFRKNMNYNKSEYDFRKCEIFAQKTIYDICKNRYEAFGASGMIIKNNFIL